jgi:hypothetical protein
VAKSTPVSTSQRQAIRDFSDAYERERAERHHRVDAQLAAFA